MVGPCTSEIFRQSWVREATLKAMLLCGRSEYLGLKGRPLERACYVPAPETARGGRTAALCARSGWWRIRDGKLLTHRAGSEHCWASSNMLEPS